MVTRIMTIILLGWMVSLSVTACTEDKQTHKMEQITKVNAKKIEIKEVPDLFEFTGNVEGVQRVKLSTKLMGTITYFPFEAGAAIREGQILAKINSTDLLAKRQQARANIAQAEAALTNMNVNYERVKSLYEKNSATGKEMEDIQMAYDVAVAQANAARQMENEINDVLSYAVIKAPFPGFIVNKFYEEGDLTAPGYPIMIVENFSAFKVKASVSASDINRFNKGDQVKVYIDELNGRIFTGVLDEINPGATPGSRQYEVQVMISSDNQDIEGIKSGMYAKVISEDSKRKMILIDKDDLIERGQLKGVYTVSSHNEALLRWLRLGEETDHGFEVLSGLNEGDMVILNKNVREGQKVEVM
ncbi:MAG: efflux RND transporter periplasmic adaptor subunit [Calditrichaceae bacterium]